MKLLENMKIKMKFVILIVVMLIGTMSIGTISYYYNTRSNNALKKMYNENLLSLEKVSDARNQNRANIANVLDLMITADEAGRDTILNDFNSRTGKIKTDIAEVGAKKADLTDYEKKQIKLINDNIAKWGTMSKQIIDLVKANKASDGIALFKDSGQSIAEELQTSIRDLENYQVKVADKAYKVNKFKGQGAIYQIIFLNFLISILCIAIGYVISRTISVSIRKVDSLIKKTSNLDLIYDHSYDHLLVRKDEIGSIAQSVEELRNVLRNMVGNVLRISNNLAASSEELAASTEENTKTIQQIVNAVNEIAAGNSAQADMVEKANGTVSAMVSNMEDINKDAEINSESAKKSQKIIEGGQQAIDLTTQRMSENIKVSKEVGDSINELSSQMDKVGNIVTVIKGISEQTNMLALNASIEAARAGDAGKGFAVVASEIGKLAQNTASAVDEITSIISDAISRNEVTAANNERAREIVSEQEKAVETTSKAFHKIKLSVADIAERTVKVSENLNEIYKSSNEISKQTLDMSAVAQEAAASSEEISASNEEQLASIEMIASAANDLSGMATELNNEITKFKL